MDRNSFSRSSICEGLQQISVAAEPLPPSQTQSPVQATPPPSQTQLPLQATSPSSASLQSYRRSAIRKTVRPSCTLCRRRKIKCDRSDPCSHCVRAGAVCVFSTPSGAPRGRKGGRRKLDSELLDRIANLETMLKQGVPGATPAASTMADKTPTVCHCLVFSTCR
jgi:Fungal Zn(2)-Cys(6) binuclear cluster domain